MQDALKKHAKIPWLWQFVIKIPAIEHVSGKENAIKNNVF